MAVELESPPTRGSQPVKRLSRQVLLISIAVHAAFLLGAGFWVVSKYVAGRKLTFAAGPKSPNPAERALEHRVQVQQKLQSTNAPPAVPKRVLTTGQAKVQLPPLPSLPVDPAAQAPMMAAAGQNPGFKAPGAMASAGGTGSGAPINFFGIRDTSSNVVIMIDVSDSMFTRTSDAEYPSKLLRQGKEQNFQVVRDEATRLIESLGSAVNFGVVRWSGGAYSWKPELMPATEENKSAAIDHIQNQVDFKKAKPNKGRAGGTRHDYALAEAFALKPEVIYMITDGNATAAQEGGGLKPIPAEEIFKVVEDGQKNLPKRARIHVIYYVTGKEKADERQMLMNLAARTSGKFNRVEAKGRQR